MFMSTNFTSKCNTYQFHLIIDVTIHGYGALVLNIRIGVPIVESYTLVSINQYMRTIRPPFVVYRMGHIYYEQAHVMKPLIGEQYSYILIFTKSNSP